MKKLVMLGVMGIAFAVVGAEEPKFDSAVWYGIKQRAEQQAAKEFEKEFVVEAESWESGKGVALITPSASGTYWLKFSPDGRLVKKGKNDSDFPEVVRLEKRTSELTKQMREEYAKSLDVTVGDIEKALGSRLLGRSMTPEQRQKLADARKKLRVEGRKKSEAEQNRVNAVNAKLNAELQKAKEERLKKETASDAQK